MRTNSFFFKQRVETSIYLQSESEERKQIKSLFSQCAEDAIKFCLLSIKESLYRSSQSGVRGQSKSSFKQRVESAETSIYFETESGKRKQTQSFFFQSENAEKILLILFRVHRKQEESVFFQSESGECGKNSITFQHRVRKIPTLSNQRAESAHIFNR